MVELYDEESPRFSVQVGKHRVFLVPEREEYGYDEWVHLMVTVERVRADGEADPELAASVKITLHSEETGKPAKEFDLQPCATRPGSYDGMLTMPDQQWGVFVLVASISVKGRKLVDIGHLIRFAAPQYNMAEPPSGNDRGVDEAEDVDTSKGITDSGEAAAEPEVDTPLELNEPPFSFDLPSFEVAGPVEEEPAETVEPPTAGAEPEMAAEEPEVEKVAPPTDGSTPDQRFINPAIEDADPQQPLEVGAEFTLVLSVGTAMGQHGVVLLTEGELFAPGVDLIELTVHLTSQDFIIHTPEPQRLRLPRKGPSKNKVRFDVEPKKTGEGVITALFYKENNFVQGISLRLNVGTPGQPAILGSEKLGRPLDGSFAIQRRDVSLFIKPGVDGFNLTMVGVTAAEAHLPFTPEYLANLTAAARQSLIEVLYLGENADGSVVPLAPGTGTPPNIKAPYQTGFTITSPAVEKEALLRLAKAGWLLYNKIFNAPGAGDDARKLAGLLRELALSDPLKIQVISKEFLLPWGMLYMAERFDANDVQPERFLGFKHIIEQIPLQSNMPALDAELSSTPELDVSLNINDGIDAQFGVTAIADQLAFWTGVESRGQVKVARRKTAADFLQALSNPQITDEILYFYGHAQTKTAQEGGPGTSALFFSGGTSATLDDIMLAAAGCSFTRGPLVFINACESAELSPLFYDGFMPSFTSLGARGMIGSECRVPARFAAEWARRFFPAFLRGDRSLGQVFLDLRCEFLEQEHNLLGLLYSLYCDGDTRIAPGVLTD